MIPGEAVMLHGTLPPVHREAVRWRQELELAALVHSAPDGESIAPAGLVTCPMTTDVAAAETDTVIDAALNAALDQLPEPARTPTAAADDLPAGRCAGGERDDGTNHREVRPLRRAARSR